MAITITMNMAVIHMNKNIGIDMATKNVIAEAIRQLEKTNNTLYGRLDVATTAKEGSNDS